MISNVCLASFVFGAWEFGRASGDLFATLWYRVEDGGGVLDWEPIFGLRGSCKYFLLLRA